MQRFKLLLALAFIVLLSPPYSASAKKCKYQEKKVEKGRKCRKPCKDDSDCGGGKKTCNCDDVCGMTCFNLESECKTEPEEIENGFVQYEGIKYGSKAIYSCKEGYKLEGDKERTCRSDRVWSGSPPRCIAGACKYPPRITSAFHNSAGSHFDVGDVVTYKCRHGFILSGNPNITCHSNKTWSSASFVCVKVNCGEPEKPRNGYFDGTSFSFGSWITYRCDKGYDLEEPARARRYCSTTGSWSGKAANCLIRSCLPPEAPENGKAEARSRNYGDTVKYSCNQGYILEGNADGVCNENTTWGVMPVCIVDVNCDFETPSRPLCGYTSAGVVNWERIFVEQNREGLPTNSALKQGAGEAILRSPTLGDTNTRCLKFYYYLESYLSSNGDVSVSLNNERVGQIAPTSVRTPLRRWVGYQISLQPSGKETAFEISVLGNEKIWIDDLELTSGECTSRCSESNPCENKGTCIDEIGSSYYCSCTERYRGRRCQMEIICDRPTLQNGRVIGPERITFGTEISFECKEGFRIRGASFARCTRDGLSQRTPKCQEKGESECPDHFNYILGSMCYRYLRTPRPYEVAKQICAASGARLVVIQGKRVDRYLWNGAGRDEKYFWIGLRTNNSVPMWSSGDKYEGVGNDKLIELNNIRRSNCAAYHKRWTWSKGWHWIIGYQNCEEKRQYICEVWKKSASSYVVSLKSDHWMDINGIYEPVPGLNTQDDKQAYRRRGQEPFIYLYYSYSEAQWRYRWIIGKYNIANDTPGRILAYAETRAATPDKIKDDWNDIGRSYLKIDITEYSRWSKWSNWICDVTCGEGSEKRWRTCEDGEPQSMNCKGLDVEKRPCMLTPCPGSSSNEMDFDGKRYLFVQSLVNWYKANESCVNRGMEIAMVNSIRLKTTLSNRIKHLRETSAAYWVDGRKFKNLWFLANRKPFQIQEDLWDLEEPNGYPDSRDCLQMRIGGLNDHRCSEKAKFICEKELDNVCKEIRCAPGQLCRPIREVYECVCPPGTSGDNCQRIGPETGMTSPESLTPREDRCNPNPCGSGETCEKDSSEVKGFTCSCNSGHTGPLCQTKTENDPCEPDPCNGGGVCREEENDDGYACFCRSGNLGKYCEKRNACRISSIRGEVQVSFEGAVLDQFDAVSQGESVSLQCFDAEKEIVGEKDMKCIGGGAWSRDTNIVCEWRHSLCTLETIGDIFRVQFDGKVSSLPISIYSGSSLQLMCDADGETKTSVIQCQNGEWQSNFPKTCAGTSCEELQSPGNGSMKVIPSNAEKPYRPGVRIEFSCNSWYQPTGATSTRCQEDGTWSNEPTSCQEVGCLLFILDLKSDVYVKGAPVDEDIDAMVGETYTLRCRNSSKKQKIRCMGREIWNPNYKEFGCN